MVCAELEVLVAGKCHVGCLVPGALDILERNVIGGVPSADCLADDEPAHLRGLRALPGGRNRECGAGLEDEALELLLVQIDVIDAVSVEVDVGRVGLAALGLLGEGEQGVELLGVLVGSAYLGSPGGAAAELEVDVAVTCADVLGHLPVGLAVNVDELDVGAPAVVCVPSDESVRLGRSRLAGDAAGTLVEVEGHHLVFAALRPCKLVAGTVNDLAVDDSELTGPPGRGCDCGCNVCTHAAGVGEGELEALAVGLVEHLFEVLVPLAAGAVADTVNTGGLYVYLAVLEVDVDHVDAVSLHGAVAAVFNKAVVLFQTPEVAAPCFLRAELEALACREPADSVELSGGVAAPLVVDDGNHINNVVGTPVPAADGLADHVHGLGILLVFLDEDGLGCVVVGNVVAALDTHADVLVAGCECYAELGLVDAVRIAGVDDAHVVLFRTADALAPVVLCTDLELVCLGYCNVADLPDVSGNLLHVKVVVPAGAVEGTDERPERRLCGRRRSVATAGGDVCNAVGRIQIHIVIAGLCGHVAAALGHYDRSVECELAAAEVIVGPGVVAAELEAVCIERNALGSPDFGIVGDLLQVYVHAPVGDCGTDDAPGLCAFHDVQIVVLAEVDVGQAAAAGSGLDNLVELCLRVEEEVVGAVGCDCEVLTACACRKFCVECYDVRLLGDVGTCAKVDVPAAVLAELELVGSGEYDALGNVPCAVGVHLDVCIPVDVDGCDGTGDAPGTLLPAGIRIAAAAGRNLVVELDGSLCVYVAVDSVVLGRILQGCAEGHLKAYGSALVEPELAESLLQGAVGNGQDVILD